MIDIDRHWKEFQHHYLTVLEGALPEASVADVFLALMCGTPNGRVDVDAPADPDTLTFGGITRYDYYDYPGILRFAPTVRGWYDALLPLVQAITGMKAIQSPYFDSSVLALIYRDNEGQQEYHYDTQPITVLLYLNDNPDSGATAAYRRNDDGKLTLVYPKRGNILLMRGRDLKHAGLAVTSGVKMVMPMNYYVEGDTWRPAFLEDKDYWTKRNAMRTT
jgi:hypothetical protein